MKIKSVNAKSNIIDTVVDKIYNLLFGYLDSLFDDATYEKEETTIPKSQVKPEKEYVDSKGQKFNPEDFASDEVDEPSETEVEVTGDGKAIHFLPIEVEGQETPDEFTVETAPLDVFGTPMIRVKIINNTTGKESRVRIIHEDNQKELEDAVAASRKEVSASCKICLSKITGTSGVIVKLTNVSSSYDIPLTQQDIACVLSDPEFIESLPEGDSAYRLDSYDDGCDVNILEDFKFETSIYQSTLDCSVKTLSRLAELNWFAKGPDYQNFKNICEPIIYELQYQVNELAKLCIIHSVKPNFQTASSDANVVVDKWQSLKECVQNYIACLQLLTMSATADEAIMINNWIRQLNDIILYQLECVHTETCLYS